VKAGDNSKTIILPRKITLSIDGYVELLKLSKQMLEHDGDIVLNYENTTWIAANFFAVIGSIIDHHELKFYKVDQINIGEKILEVCEKNGFLPKRRYDIYDTTIKYQTFSKNERKLFSEHILTNLYGKESFPKMSKLLEKQMSVRLEEIVNNAYTHGSTDTIYTCGQYFPSQRNQSLVFTIVDLGRTIKANVSELFSLHMHERINVNGAVAIDWATEDGHTTKTGATPGGLGLGLIRNFMKTNEGKIIIVSEDGYWEESKGEKFYKELNYSFPGTIVTLEFKVKDNQFYYLKSENYF